MDFINIEKKWQKTWADTRLYSFDKSKIDKKKYVLEMFSYPSGAKLHAGHWYNYGPSDSYARYLRMKGYEVFQPMGFDAFGLPAENYAIKTGVHPQDSTLKNIETMEGQLKAIGGSFDWDYEVVTCLPEYYKWTQWIFLQLYKKGLAYRKQAPVNWCTDCNTVLANEQVIDGCCERCGHPVIRKNLTQWFFKITDYAEELLQGLDKLDWPEKTKAMQRHWIGKSQGGEIEFVCENGGSFRVFTTRADTIFGVSYVVLAPEHPLVDSLTTPEQKQAVEDYKAQTAKIAEIDRLSTTREKTGAFTGSYCINPINGERVPIWIGDYVLASYGTGAVMGVGAHDDRDYDFAKKYDLKIERVIKSADGSADDLPYCEHGVLVNSGEFDGLTTEEAIPAILAKLDKMGKGGVKTNYRLRDWLISRQRYWGCPIPIIHCDHCGEVPVPEDQLPVKLPYNVDFTPDGKSPLLKSEEFMNTTCPICGRPARRDPDTMDTFVCSSWYFLRYPDAHNDKMAFDPEIINKMLPVDKYIGGAEHACMHLLYARFFTKALRDMGYLNFDEPFTSLVHQGTILGPDGNKMSKSRGNVISPDDYVKKYGADAFRMYLMFGFSYIEGGPWNANGIDSIIKFLERVERLVIKAKKNQPKQALGKAEKELNYVRNYTIGRVDADMQTFSFNTAIARLMEFVNALYKYDGDLGDNKNQEFFYSCVDDLVLLLAPFVPHVSEELNEMMGQPYSVFNRAFPTCDESALVKDEYELAVQINSRVKAKIVVPSDADAEQIKAIALEEPTVKALLEGMNVVKAIVIPKRLVNIVVK
ncbi:MAG: leucine--tRNA ligase [Clostridia bacterium]|nr:leucine--tRNA ligase [Clostridia bacterium]MDY4082838.1 leucine--tRNA ligase [Eubacteriales bacterium]